MSKRTSNLLRSYRRRYDKNPTRTTTSVGAHMIYTEAQTLEEAVDIIANKHRKHHQKPRRKDNLDQELGYEPKPKITLPRLKFLDDE